MANLFFVAALVLFASLPHAQAQPRRGTVRLWRNGFSFSSYSSGRVQIYISSWGNICDDLDFSLTEAIVVCHQLGYSGASSQSRASSDLFGSDSYSILVDDVDCFTSSYLVILQCSHSFVVSSLCVNGRDDASVTCYTTRIWNSPYDLQIRLQRGQYSSQGLVEVYCNGQWGTVCDDTFGSAEADTVCRQLGYTSAARYDHLSVRGTISQPIWLDRMTCSFATSCLRTCQRCPSSANQHDCSHSEDVTIECQYSGSSVFTTTSTCNFGRSTVPTTPFRPPVNIGGVVGGVTAGVIILVLFSIFIPVCICICLGMGVGAACRDGNRQTTSRVVTTSVPPPTATVVTNTISTVDKNAPPAYPATAYPPSGAAYPPPGAAYPPPGAAYPPPAAYPAQPQAAFTTQPYLPPEVGGYPPQQPVGYQLPPQAYPSNPPPYAVFAQPPPPEGAYPPPPGAAVPPQ